MTKYTKILSIKLGTKVIKRPYQPDIKMKNRSTYLSALNHWTEHSVFCHVGYSITEPVISSQGQHVILFPTTKRQWQIHWPLSPELNTFITTKTTLHLLPSRPLWAPTITHTRLPHNGIISHFWKHPNLLCHLGSRLWLEACGFTDFSSPVKKGKRGPLHSHDMLQIRPFALKNKSWWEFTSELLLLC